MLVFLLNKVVDVQACNFIKNRETATQGFSCEYCAIFKNNFFEEHLSTVASNYDNLAVFFEKIC